MIGKCRCKQKKDRKLADLTGKPPFFVHVYIVFFFVFLFVNVCVFVECSSVSVSSYMLNMDEVEPDSLRLPPPRRVC